MMLPVGDDDRARAGDDDDANELFEEVMCFVGGRERRDSDESRIRKEGEGKGPDGTAVRRDRNGSGDRVCGNDNLRERFRSDDDGRRGSNTTSSGEAHRERSLIETAPRYDGSGAVRSRSGNDAGCRRSRKGNGGNKNRDDRQHDPRTDGHAALRWRACTKRRPRNTNGDFRLLDESDPQL